MTVEELILHLYRACFMLLATVTFIDYVRHHDKIRRDIFLVFFCIGMPTFIQFFAEMVDMSGGLIPIISQLALVAQPYMTVRVLRYFRDVPQTIYRGALGGMLLAWGAILTFGLTSVALVVVLYFLLVDGYAIFAFFSGALSSNGVVRQRLRFAAAGSALLVFALFLGGVNTVFPEARAHTLPLIRLFVIFSAIAYYLGFAPPRWLRYAWKHSELRNYLQSIQLTNDRSLGGVLADLYGAVTRGMGTDVVLVKAGLWDKKTERLVLQNTPFHPAAPSDSHLDVLLDQAWKQQAEVAIDVARGASSEERQLLAALKAETLLVVPMTTYDQPLGVLAVGLKHSSLFIDGDLRLLAIFAQQMAVQVHHYNLINALASRNEDLENLVGERTADLQRSNEELKMLAYVASHDLQEPLRTISSYLQLVEKNYKDKLDDEGREFIEFAVDGASRMKELIEDVLIYSRVETTRKHFTRFSAQQIVNDIIRSLETVINESGAIILTDELPDITADKRLMTQLFQNLLSNAVKYRGDRHPEIRIAVEKKSDHWQFSVKDNGIGIEPQYLDQIFVIFRRLHHREAYKGTGIGLAVCKKAVELHGGRIWVESVYGSGSTFLFTLPF